MVTPRLARRMLGMVAPTVLPLVFCAVWLTLLIRVLGYSTPST